MARLWSRRIIPVNCVGFRLGAFFIAIRQLVFAGLPTTSTLTSRRATLSSALPCGAKILPFASSRSLRSMPGRRGRAPTSSATSTSLKATIGSEAATMPWSRGKAQSSSSIITPLSAFCAFSSGISSICSTTGWSLPSISPLAMRNKSEYPIWPAAPVTATRTGGFGMWAPGIDALEAQILADCAKLAVDEDPGRDHRRRAGGPAALGAARAAGRGERGAGKAEPRLRARAHPRRRAGAHHRGSAARKRPRRAHGPGRPCARRHEDRLGRPRKLLHRHPQACRQALRGLRADQPAGGSVRGGRTARRPGHRRGGRGPAPGLRDRQAVGEFCRKGGKAAPGLRFHLRLRRLSWSVAQEHAARGAARIREGVSLRLAWSPVGDAAAARYHVLQPPARLRPRLDAQPPPQPLL